MKVGVTLFFQNYFDWDRYDARGFDRPSATPDSHIYDEELRLGDLIEPLGFDAIWTVEHHHTPYTMIPDPTQLLSYYAGRTSKADMGTMVMVLPWHNPLHVAENIALLDNLLQGRTTSRSRRPRFDRDRGRTPRSWSTACIAPGEARRPCPLPPTRGWACSSFQ
jgi:hypothetical protein